MRERRPSPRDAPSTSGKLREGDEIDVSIDRILPGGLGLAHADKHTVLVALSAPGDKASVRIERVRHRVAFAKIVELKSRSPVRVEPPCPYFGRCGGCDFQQLTYDAQLHAKGEIVRDCLRRIARLEPLPDLEITPSPIEWRYRARARWQHDPVRRRLGFYERGSHRVCDVVECAVASDSIQTKLSSLRDRLTEGELPDITEFEAIAGDTGVALEPPLDANDEQDLQLTIGSERYQFGAGSFFQINHALLEQFLLEGLGSAGGSSALDLYCGVGLFTLPLARRFQQVVGVEGNPASARFARNNLAAAGLKNARIEQYGVAEWMTSRSSRHPVDFVLLDPPRTGAEPETISTILALRPQHVSYVSCDPATLARDLRSFLEQGYAIASIRALDMFPQTHHVETVVHLKG